MEKYLELLKELKALGEELMAKGIATDEVECMDMHLECAIETVAEEMEG